MRPICCYFLLAAATTILPVPRAAQRRPARNLFFAPSVQPTSLRLLALVAHQMYTHSPAHARASGTFGMQQNWHLPGNTRATAHAPPTPCTCIAVVQAPTGAPVWCTAGRGAASHKLAHPGRTHSVCIAAPRSLGLAALLAAGKAHGVGKAGPSRAALAQRGGAWLGAHAVHCWMACTATVLESALCFFLPTWFGLPAALVPSCAVVMSVLLVYVPPPCERASGTDTCIAWLSNESGVTTHWSLQPGLQKGVLNCIHCGMAFPSPQKA